MTRVGSQSHSLPPPKKKKNRKVLMFSVHPDMRRKHNMHGICEKCNSRKMAGLESILN